MKKTQITNYKGLKKFYFDKIINDIILTGNLRHSNKKVLDLIESDYSSWEIDILPKLAEKSQLNSFMHEGFWQPMDTLRDKNTLENLWNTKPPWKKW